MTELGEIFTELGISQYLHDFLDQGFDTWETILDITETDFDILGVKLGHRRKLQRKIANSRGLSSDRAIGSPSLNTLGDDLKTDEQKFNGSKSGAKDGGNGPHGAKRKYRRHPKPDENAPERPPSAYVIFSNKMREDLKGRNLSFTEIAKLVGENWQNLAPSEKEPFEQQAFSAKDRYNSALGQYKKTKEYRDYSQYLAEFKAKQSNQQQASDSDPSKRPKLEAHLSGASANTASSGASPSNETTSGRVRVESTASSAGQWPNQERQLSPQLSGMKALTVVSGRQISPPNSGSPPVLPGYRDSILNAPSQVTVWRDGHREDATMSDQPQSTTSSARHPSHIAVPDSPNPPALMRHLRTQPHGPPPPLLSSESTAGRSTGSAGSTSSSILYSPSTPLEPPLDRALPIPALFAQKSSVGFDTTNQLPPLLQSSLSPQSSILGYQASPNGIQTFVDYPGTARGYTAPSTQHVDNNDSRMRDYFPPISADEPLDPINALLKAGEIVNSRNRQSPP